MTRIGRIFILTALIALAPERGFAQPYPSKPIKLVVAQAPGGQNDVIARILTQRLAEIMRQPVVIENRGGAGGTIGADFVAKAPTDGYTLLVGGSNNLGAAVALVKDLRYNPATDFMPIGGIARVPYGLAVNSRIPVVTVPELIAYARMHPGRLIYGSSGNGSMSSLAAELFKASAGVDMIHVPYRGSAPAVSDLVAGQIDVMFADLALLIPHARTGALRLLATIGAKRAAGAPELPTVAEQGMAGFVIEPWYGLVAPVGTPREVVATLEGALAQALRSDEVRRRFLQLGYEPIDEASFGLEVAIRSDIAKYSAIVRSAGIKAEP